MLSETPPEQPAAGQPTPGAGTLQPLGWVQGWQPQIAMKCRIADGTVLGLSIDGYIHLETAHGLTNPVGVVRPSQYREFLYFLNNGRGFELPVDHVGRVLQYDGVMYHVVGICSPP